MRGGIISVISDSVKKTYTKLFVSFCDYKIWKIQLVTENLIHYSTEQMFEVKILFVEII